MIPLRAALDVLADEAPVYGDLDRAIEQAEVERQRRLGTLGSLAAAAAVLVVMGTMLVLGRAQEREAQPAGPVGTPPALGAGQLDPGRYLFVLKDACASPPVDCTPGVPPPPPLGIEVTVPAGWQHLRAYPGVLTPAGTVSPTEGPDGAALLLGWTNHHVGLYSDPCRSEGDDEGPDVPVGPTVDDFVEAVQAHEAIDASVPSPARVGGHPARFFTVRNPADLDHPRCDVWRPWEPGIYAQGPANTWEVWAVDVDGSRVVILAQHFPGTPVQVREQLHGMVVSLSFDPA